MMRVKWIDGAKGIAILMVIAIHLSQCLPNLWRPVMVAASFGAMCVQLFFDNVSILRLYDMAA